MAHFEVKSRRVIMDNKGNDKSVTEAFFVQDCVSFAEAETKTLRYYNCENDVIGMAISKVMEVVNTPTQEEKMDMFVYRAVIASIFTDDEGNEKEMKYPVLMWAKSIDDAMTTIKGHIQQGLEDMTLVSLQKTKIVEVI